MKNRVRSWVRVSLVSISALGLVSCASLLGREGELSMKSVSIYADLDANENSATAVDLVLVYNLELIQTLSKMSAVDYFAASKQLLLDNPGMLDVWHWELVPGQIVDKFKPAQPKWEAFAAFIFADYLTPGEHRLKVPCNGIVSVLLLKSGLKSVSVSDCGPDHKEGRTGNVPDGEGKPFYDEMCTIKTAPLKKGAPCYAGRPVSLTAQAFENPVRSSTVLSSPPAFVAVQPLPPIGAVQKGASNGSS